MNKLLFVCLFTVCACAQTVPGLRGTVTDPSGAAVPGAAIQLRGRGGERSTRTNSSGEYAFAALPAGNYQIRIAANGFTPVFKKIAVGAPVVFDARLVIQTETHVVNVDDRAGGVDNGAESNSGALLLGSRELGVLSDDPDELAMQLQALAGPAPGPDGGQMFVDGFSGGSLPPSRPYARSASTPIRFRRNMIARDSPKSKSLPSPAAAPFTVRHSASSTIPF